MNKAFVREPEFDGKAYCPKCGSLGTPVNKMTLDHHLLESSRQHMGDLAWFCNFTRCEVAYFDLFERYVMIDVLRSTVYPKDSTAPICACFDFTIDDVEADVQQGTPSRIRELLAKSKSQHAQCERLAADGRSCMPEVQRLYMRRISGRQE